MDNQKFQELVLEQLGSLGNRMEQFEKGQQTFQADIQQLQSGQHELQDGQRNIWTCLDTLVLNQNQMRKDIETIKIDVGNIRQSQVRVEHDFSRKINALFDSRESQIETNKEVAARLDRLEAKL